MYNAGEHRNGGLGTSERLGRCPSCLKPVAVYQEWVEVNGSIVHASCARQGEYEEPPSPGWAKAAEVARSRYVP